MAKKSIIDLFGIWNEKNWKIEKKIDYKKKTNQITKFQK